VLAAIRRQAGDLLVTVRVTPRAHVDAIDGAAVLADGSRALQVRVRAVPEDGRANAAVAALLATSLGVPKPNVTLASGASRRLKSFRIASADAGLEATLAALLGGPED
jgi:uncharacterized protein YggU (UPF0235/DUF167 family)